MGDGLRCLRDVSAGTWVEYSTSEAGPRRAEAGAPLSAFAVTDAAGVVYDIREEDRGSCAVPCIASVSA